MRTFKIGVILVSLFTLFSFTSEKSDSLCTSVTLESEESVCLEENSNETITVVVCFDSAKYYPDFKIVGVTISAGCPYKPYGSAIYNAYIMKKIL